MPITYLHQESQTDGRNDLPLLRNWCKDQVKLGNEPYDQPLTVHELKESRSGDWVVASMQECVALIPAKSEIGINLLELMPKLRGEGNRLVIIPHRKGKLGFSVGVDDSVKVYYSWDKDEEYLRCCYKHVPQSKPINTIKLEDIQPSTSPQTSVDTSKPPRKGKAKPDDADSGEI